MAKRKALISKNAIHESLLAQLDSRGASKPHFIDLVKDYMSLWDVKEALSADISTRGVSYLDVSSTGVEMWKNNPSVRELHFTNRQMLLILKELGLTTDKVDNGDVDI